MFWADAFPVAACVSLEKKYEALADVAAQVPGAERQVALRRLAHAWPGSLREAELVGPRVCAARLASLVEIRGGVGVMSRGYWRTLGASALPLWSELHDLLRDQLEWRTRVEPGECGRGATAVHRFIASAVAHKQRWPSADQLMRVAGADVGSKQAHRWLAHRAGLDHAALRRVLYAEHRVA